MNSNNHIAINTNPTFGLSQSEVESRIKQYGYNEVIEKKTSSLFLFLRKFWGFNPWMLELIIILSLILNRLTDAYVVSVLLLFNSVVGFIQENKSSKAIEALKKKLQISVKLLRDGIWKTIPARELVPGDVIRIRTGDFIPADIKLVEGELKINQSALTGESEDVKKKTGEDVNSGAIVTSGEATGIVFSIGANTYYGKTMQLVNTAKPKLHIDILVSKIVKWLFVVIIILLAITLIVSYLKGIRLLEILPLMLVLLMGAIPVAISTMFTLSMALGSKKLLKEGVLITRLDATNDAASMDILFVDKTGTLTKNKLSVAKFLPFDRFTDDDVLLYGALASQEANHDSIDVAFITAAKQKNILQDSYKQKSFIPFSALNRKTEALIKSGSEEFKAMKGSFQTIIEICGSNEITISEFEKKINEFAKEGYRTIAVAKESIDGKAEFVGIVALHDPPRDDSTKLIKDLENTGVSVKMLTGDSLPIAQEIAKAVGLGNILKASILKNLDDKSIVELLEKNGGVAEVYPEDKYRILKAFQANGHIVGMTGDGVNDAPALKQAEVGIAVSSATDIAKNSSSIVLTEEGLASILSPIKLGRMMFERINAFILQKISNTISKTVFVVLAFIFLGKFVVSASAMLLMILLHDFAMLSYSTDNVRGAIKPSIWNVKGQTKIAVILGIIMTFETFGLLYFGINYFNLKNNIPALQTFGFELLLFPSYFSMFVFRERNHFWNSMPSKIYLIVVIAIMIIGVIIPSFGLLGFESIPITQTLFVIGYYFVFSLIVNDLIKFNLIKRVGAKV